MEPYHNDDDIDQKYKRKYSCIENYGFLIKPREVGGGEGMYLYSVKTKHKNYF